MGHKEDYCEPAAAKAQQSSLHRQVNIVTVNNNDNYGHVNNPATRRIENRKYVTVQHGSSPIRFLLDTGCDVSIHSESMTSLGCFCGSNIQLIKDA